MSQQRQQPAEEDPLLRDFPDQAPGPVLLSDQIQYYCLKHDPPLICRDDGALLEDKDFNDCLDNASYKLRLGYEVHVGGRWQRLSDKNPLRLDPHQVAVVTVYEKVNIPRFLVARWNLRVSMVYEGLLWVGGPQVDPGWSGTLCCPIYNLAEREVVIRPLHPIFTIEFTRTTPFYAQRAPWGYISKSNHSEEDKRGLRGFDRYLLRSAPFEALNKVNDVENRLNIFIPLALVLLTVMIAALGVIATITAGFDVRPGVKEMGWVLVAAVLGVGLLLGLTAAVAALPHVFNRKRHR